MPDNDDLTVEAAVAALRELVDRAPRINTEHGNPFVAYRIVDAAEAERLRITVGIEAEGFAHIVDASAVRHILRGHRGEPRAGQLAITPEDIALIPHLTADPDEIKEAGTNKRGLAGVRYRKRVNGHVFYVEEVRRGRKQLAASTMYKYPAATHEED